MLSMDNKIMLPVIFSILILGIMGTETYAIIYDSEIQVTNPTPERNEFFGRSVSLDGNNALIGAYLDDTGAEDTGAAYLYPLVNPVPTLQEQKFEQITILESLFDDAPTKTQKILNNAIQSIQKSLDEKLWRDGISLEPKHGHKVFDKEKKAVKSLLKIEKKDDSTEVSSVIDVLVAIDRQLASDAFDEANTPENHADKKSSKQLSKSESELTKGDQKRDDGKPDKAIDHYKKAWKHAQKAMKHDLVMMTMMMTTNMKKTIKLVKIS